MPAGLFSGLICWPVSTASSENYCFDQFDQQIARASSLHSTGFSMVFFWLLRSWSADLCAASAQR
jgi:hypothetical protein